MIDVEVVIDLHVVIGVGTDEANELQQKERAAEPQHHEERQVPPMVQERREAQSRNLRPKAYSKTTGARGVAPPHSQLCGSIGLAAANEIHIQRAGRAAGLFGGLARAAAATTDRRLTVIDDVEKLGACR
jgi:hypothetical protein